MYKLIIRLMVIAALAKLGISLKDFATCEGRSCIARFEKASRNVLRVDWKPISVWPDEGEEV